MTEEALTVEQFKAALPADMKMRVDPLMVMRINNIMADPEEAEVFKDSLLSHASVMREGKFKLSSYVDAVRYVGFKVMGLTNREAHQRTFPDKHSDWSARGISSKDVASYTTAYNKSKLVNLIYDQTLIPTHILNAGALQEAINQQLYLAKNAKSEMVQSNACTALMTHLKAPETKKVELDIAVKESPLLEELKNITLGLAREQQRAISEGLSSSKEIAHQTIVEAEVIDD